MALKIFFCACKNPQGGYFFVRGIYKYRCRTCTAVLVRKQELACVIFAGAGQSQRGRVMTLLPDLLAYIHNLLLLHVHKGGLVICASRRKSDRKKNLSCLGENSRNYMGMPTYQRSSRLLLCGDLVV